MIVAGFDPGGRDNFGWCVLRANPFDTALNVEDVVVGTAERAISAGSAVIEQLGDAISLDGAGIDAPLFCNRLDGRLIESCMRCI